MPQRRLALSEVPEHLLERSRQRRAALGLGGDEAGAPTEASAAPAVASESAATPATASAASPAKASAEPAVPAAPEPLPPYVEASIQRKRVPMWALPVVALLPLWAFLYVGTLSEPETEAEGQLALGAEIYTQCAGCHGANGGGGAGRQLSDGEVLLTFPGIDEQLEFVAVGSAGFRGEPYGNPERPGGAHIGGEYGNMPAFLGTLTDEELLAVIRHERESIGGEVVPPAQLGPEGELLHANGTPYLNDAGELQDAEGNVLLEDGRLLNPGTGATGAQPVVAMGGR
jgi:mono/diheme cytochrome c family protein